MDMAADDVWTDDDLEYIGKCPICMSSRRTVLFNDLEDWAFRSTNGRWVMWRCVDCSSLYLDPRPNELSIGRAYRRYYTHAVTTGSGGSNFQKLLSRVKSAAKHGYYRVKFGHTASLFEVACSAPIFFLHDRKLKADLFIRHIGRPASPGQRLLDIGCGSGAFLKTATKIGYRSFGLDPDPKAVEAGTAQKIEIGLGSLPNSGFPDDWFSHVTLSHVFEHLHYPVDSLKEIWRILEPGGRVWMAFPNPNSRGLELFGKYWRGLEAPRHLALPHSTALTKLFEITGYSDVEFRPHPSCGTFFVESSLAERAGLDPNEESAIEQIRSSEAQELAREIDRLSKQDWQRGEILVVTAKKTVA